MAAPAKGPSNPLLNPTQILSGQNLQNAAHQIADAQTAGPLAELAKQIAQQNQQGAAAQGKTSGYFNQLGNFAQQGYNQEGQVANDLNAQLQGIASDTANRLQANSNDQINSYLSHVPAGQGGNLGQFGAEQVIQNGQQNSANAMRDAQTFRSGGALQGANYRDLAASNLGTFAQRGQETLGNIARATRLAEAPLNQKVAGLDASKGALYSTALGKLRSDERNYATALEGLGLKQASLAATVSNNNAKNQLTARGQDVNAQNNLRNNQTSSANSLRSTQTSSANNIRNNNSRAFNNNPNAVGSAAWYRVQQTQAKGRGSAPRLTAGQNLAGARALGAVVNAVTAWQQGGMKNSKGQVQVPHPTDNQMKQVLGSKYDPNLIEAAFELLGYGSIDQSTYNALTGSGYNLKGGWTFRGRPIKVTANYSPSNPRMNPGGTASGTGSAISGLGGAVGRALGA